MIEMKKKICFVVTSPFAINGFLVNHLIELSKIYNIVLCTNLNQYKISPKLNILNLDIVNIPFERRISLARDLYCWWVLFKIFRHYRFSSVHSITPKSGLLGMSAAFFARIPQRFHTFTGQIWVNSKGGKRFFFRSVDWLIARFSNYVFTDSASQIHFLVAEGVCKIPKISMLGSGSICGVDLIRFRRDSFSRMRIRDQVQAGEGDCIFLFVGRLCRDKGLFDLVQAFSSLRRKGGDAILCIVGPDEEDIISRLRDRFPELHHSVKWVGATNRPEDYMSAADVLVLPSYREGFGMVIIEAAACRIPTIAYRIDGVVDAVVDGRTGLLVNLGDIDALERQMELLLIDKSLRESLGLSAWTRACRDFEGNSITKSWIDFYTGVLT